MTLFLRQRILLTVAPLVLLLAGLGTTGAVLLVRLGQRSDAILRENYDSVRAMTRLRFAVLANDWPEIETQFLIEKNNITILPDEPRLVEELRVALDRYRVDAHHRGEVLRLADAIRDLNENQMQQASEEARRTARVSAVGFGVGVALSVLAALAAAWWLQRTLLEPIRSVTEAATAIGSGQLHLMVPVQSHDEVGQLAEAFNAMMAKLRAYRQTDTERLLRARQTGQATIDSFPDPVVVIDMLGCVEIANPTAQRLLGVHAPRDGEQRLVWTPPESLRQAVEDAMRHQQPVVKQTFDQAVTFRLDTEDRVYLPQVRPIRASEGELLGAAVVLHDITQFRLLDRLKSDWVATVSHELKTPLTSVRLAVHVLLEEVVGPLEPKQVELLVEARLNTERLLKLIDHLLSLARLEDGREQLDLRPVEPVALLRAAAEEAASRAEDKRIEIVIEDAPGLPAVAADPVRLGRALNNLLNNAITHTESGGKVVLSTKMNDDSRVRLTVSDTGIGIPPEHLPHIFDRFFRVPGREGTPGTGLGLAIVREIVVAHDGEITCESDLGRGTTFHITLPAWKEGT
jgi:NtrC-family two-component system sensor histidine kinase KinB